MSFIRQFNRRHVSCVNRRAESSGATAFREWQIATNSRAINATNRYLKKNKTGSNASKTTKLRENRSEASRRKANFSIQPKQNLVPQSSKWNSTSSTNNCFQLNLCVTFPTYQYQVCIVCGTIPVIRVSAPPKSCENGKRAFACIICAFIRSSIPIKSYDRSKNIACPSCEHLSSLRCDPDANVCGLYNRTFICLRYMNPFYDYNQDTRSHDLVL